jgi:hypothetical protein
MTSICKSVDLDRVDWNDLRFAIPGYLPEDSLRASCRRHGILHPPWLWERENGFHCIVDGFKRLGWVRESGRDELLCLVFRRGSSLQELWLRRVEGKLQGPPLNGAEKAQLISKSASFLQDCAVVKEIARCLGIPFRESVIRSWVRVADAGPDLLQAVARGDLCEKAALELSAWEAEEQVDFLKILENLHFSASVQIEIIERVQEIARIRESPRRAVLQAPELQTIVHDRQGDHRRKTEALRELLAGWRFPRLQAKKNQFHLQLRKVALPGHTHIVPPPAFEGDSWRLQTQFSSIEELRSRLQQVLGLADGPELSELFDIPRSPQ